MITPVSDEAEWIQCIQAAAVWVPPREPMLVIAPHPDDETLGAGGLISWQRRAGIDVTLVAVTDGENAYPRAPGLGPVREREQAAAMGLLGVADSKIVRLRLPDSDVSSSYEELVERLAPLVSEETHVVAPWRGDFHPDHEACGRAAEEVARRTGARLTSYFFWTWHLGSSDLLRGLPLLSFQLDDDARCSKARALLCHVSQLGSEWGEPILPQSLLAPASRPVEIFLSHGDF